MSFKQYCKTCNSSIETFYNYNDKNIIINDCKQCIEKKLVEIKCNGNKNKKCNNIYCKECYYSSFFSFEKSHCWSSQNTDHPRLVPLKSGKQYLFECDKLDCRHTFSSKLLNVVTGGTWCSYCSGLNICGNKDCKKCFDKSFASTEQSKYWDFEKNKDENGISISPLNVTKSSNKNYFLICDKGCGHSYSVKLNNVTNLNRKCSYCANKILCENNDCKTCFDKSFASHEMSKYWDDERNKDANGNNILPRQVFKNSGSKYNFKCSNNECKNTINNICLNDIKYDSRECDECKKIIFDKNKERKGKCAYENNCESWGVYNYETETQPLYCKKHKLENMIDLVNLSKLCKNEGCKYYALYNNENEDKPLYCKFHKTENMECKIKQVCDYEDCELTASYNYPDKKTRLKCSKHKEEGMIDHRHSFCIEPNCDTQASFNYIGEKKYLYCMKHKKDDMINVKSPRCKFENCLVMGNKKYDGYCLFCFVHLFPDVKITYNYKAKEKHIVDSIKSKFPDFSWKLDKKIQDGCSNRRPDLLVDMGFNIIIIEIDEEQHNNYSCENRRTMEISKDFNHRPIVIIRFNPDSYINCKNETVQSCFKLDSKGLLIIRNKKDFENRLKVLYKQIEYWCSENNINEKTVNIINLFYDNYN
jgi:hypothetical protein